MDTTTSASTVSLGGETVKATVAKFTMALSGFVGTILFARWLGAASFGGFYLVLSVLRIIDRPSSGWARAVKKRFAESQSDDAEMFGALVLGLLIWNVISITGAWALARQLRNYTGLSTAPEMFTVLMVALSTLTLLSLVESKGLVGLTQWIDAFRSYLTLGLQVLFVFLGFGVAGMAYGLSMATLLTVPIGLYYLNTRPVFPGRETVCSVWEFAKYSIPLAYLGRAYDRFDVLLLGYLLTPAVVANYEISARLTLPATFVASAVASLLMPRISALEGQDDAISEDITNAVAFSSIIAIPMFFGTLAIPEHLVVTFYGPEYAEAWILLVGLGTYRLVATQTEPLYQALDGLDKPDVTVRISGIALALNVPLGVALVLHIGAVGVVIATVIAELVRYAGAAVVLKRTVKDLKLLSTALLKQFASGAVMFALVLLLNRLVSVRSWVDLFLIIGLGAITYSVTLLIISRELRYTITGIVEGTRLHSYAFPIVKRVESFSRRE